MSKGIAAVFHEGNATTWVAKSNGRRYYLDLQQNEIVPAVDGQMFIFEVVRDLNHEVSTVKLLAPVPVKGTEISVAMGKEPKGPHEGRWKSQPVADGDIQRVFIPCNTGSKPSRPGTFKGTVSGLVFSSPNGLFQIIALKLDEEQMSETRPKPTTERGMRRRNGKKGRKAAVALVASAP